MSQKNPSVSHCTVVRDEETQGWALAVSEGSPIPCPHLSPLYIRGLACAGCKSMGSADGAWQEMGVQGEGSPTVAPTFV